MSILCLRMVPTVVTDYSSLFRFSENCLSSFFQASLVVIVILGYYSTAPRLEVDASTCRGQRLQIPLRTVTTTTKTFSSMHPRQAERSYGKDMMSIYSKAVNLSARRLFVVRWEQQRPHPPLALLLHPQYLKFLWCLQGQGTVRRNNS